MYLLELGGEDDRFAAAEARAAATEVSVLAPGIGTASAITVPRLETLAFTHRASTAIGTATGGTAAATSLLESASLDRTGSVAVRARNVRNTAAVDTPAVERELGAILVDHGLTVDLEAPDHELRALFSEDTVALGWLVAESVRDYGQRRPTDRPFFQPGGMSPLLARALVNLSLLEESGDAVLLDPMCGTGGTLIEAGLVGARPVGVDAQPRMVRGTRRNLETYLTDEYAVLCGDATRLPLNDDIATAVVVDIPYGRQSKRARHDAPTLHTGALAEAHRLAPRAVVVADHALDSAIETTDWTLTDQFERRVHRSLVRHIHVLSR
ncbi:MAG: methyltransferase domain-containing protein [Halobacteriaceae archaeon]